MKIKLSLLAIALLLSACGTDIRGEHKETESITVSLTEPEPEPEPLPLPEPAEEYELGAFLPIIGKYKENTELEDRFRPYVEKILLGEDMLSSADMMSNGLVPYVGEIINDDEPSYWYWRQLDENFISNREQLLNFFRTVYTDSYLDSLFTDWELSFEDALFVGEEYFEPLFTEGDGVMYKLRGRGGKDTVYDTDGFRVKSCDDKNAEIFIHYTADHGEGFETLNLRHDEGQGWRLDSISDNYYITSFNAVAFGNDPLRIGPEFVFDHLSKTTDEYIDTKNGRYYKLKNRFRIKRLRQAFSDYISEYKWDWDSEAEDFVQTDEPLLDKYIKKCVDDVYIERDGFLYRKEGAPVYEFPEGDEESLINISLPSGKDVYIQEFDGQTVIMLRNEEGTRIVTELPLREVT